MGRNPVPFSGVIVGKGKGGVGHRVVTVCISHISSLVKHGLDYSKAVDDVGETPDDDEQAPH